MTGADFRCFEKNQTPSLHPGRASMAGRERHRHRVRIRRSEKWPGVIHLGPRLTMRQYLNCGRALSWSLVALYTA
jgi:hypothetical protein